MPQITPVGLDPWTDIIAVHWPDGITKLDFVHNKYMVKGKIQQRGDVMFAVHDPENPDYSDTLDPVHAPDPSADPEHPRWLGLDCRGRQGTTEDDYHLEINNQNRIGLLKNKAEPVTSKAPGALNELARMRGTYVIEFDWFDKQMRQRELKPHDTTSGPSWQYLVAQPEDHIFRSFRVSGGQYHNTFSAQQAAHFLTFPEGEWESHADHDYDYWEKASQDFDGWDHALADNIPPEFPDVDDPLFARIYWTDPSGLTWALAPWDWAAARGTATAAGSPWFQYNRLWNYLYKPVPAVIESLGIYSSPGYFPDGAPPWLGDLPWGASTPTTGEPLGDIYQANAVPQLAIFDTPSAFDAPHVRAIPPSVPGDPDNFFFSGHFDGGINANIGTSEDMSEGSVDRDVGEGQWQTLYGRNRMAITITKDHISVSINGKPPIRIEQDAHPDQKFPRAFSGTDKFYRGLTLDQVLAGAGQGFAFMLQASAIYRCIWYYRTPKTDKELKKLSVVKPLPAADDKNWEKA